MPRDVAASKLREMGDITSAVALERNKVAVDKTFGGSSWFSTEEKAWQHTAYAFGFIPAGATSEKVVAIRHAGDIEADRNLKGRRVKVTLDRLRVASYPGRGTHQILFDFYAQNQLEKDVEHLHFNAIYRVREGEFAPVIGFPIFIGLHVGAEGVAFKCFTVNVKNDEDEKLLGFLDSDIFKAGLRLASTAQPAIKPFSQMAFALTQSIASRSRNVPVQDFYMGLDFSNVQTRARLAQGSYLAVQVPQKLRSVWNWSDWVYMTDTGEILQRDSQRTLIPFNYIVYGVSLCED